MKHKRFKNKALAILFFLFAYDNIFAYASGTNATCRYQERVRENIITGQKIEVCKERSQTIEERIKGKHTFLYLKIPKLGDEYLDYGNEDAEFNLESVQRKERALPVYIEFNGAAVLNPRKADRQRYQVSSKRKEQIISENPSIVRRNCTFMALGSEYLFPVPAKEGILSVMLYFDYSKDVVQFSQFRMGTPYGVPEKYFDQFIHRGLQNQVNFEPGRIYQIEIAINPNSALPRGSYNATTRNTFETMNTVPGFTITLKELPPNTKFAFDGKDDVGKTYEQVKKEFILYDHDAEKTKE